MNPINMVALQKKVSYMRWSFYGSLFSQRLQYTFSKCIITIQDVLKKVPYNGLKIDIYEFNQFSCSPKKVFLYEVETFWSLLSKYIYIYTYFMCIFTVQGVLKNRQCRDMGLKLKYMISMIIDAISKNVFFYEVEHFVSILSKYIHILIQSVFHIVGMCV